MPDRPCLGHAAEAHYPLAVDAEGVGVGTRHQPHSARSCELALRDVGPAEGRRGRGALAWVWGARRWALSHAQPSVCGACGQGPLPTSSRCAGCGRGDPSPTPQRALLRTGFDLCGGGTRAPGGAGSRLAVGRPRLGALPQPSAPPWGVQLGPTTHWRWVRGVLGMGARHDPHSAHSVGVALGRPGGEGVSCLGVGRPGWGAPLRPTARPWNVQVGPATHWP